MRTALVLLALVNGVRAQHHLPPLRNVPSLDHIARVCTEGHLRSCAADFHARAAGMNTAFGYGTPREALRAWMNSPQHRANILGRYRLTGLAVWYSRTLGPVYAEVFIQPQATA